MWTEISAWVAADASRAAWLLYLLNDKVRVGPNVVNDDPGSSGPDTPKWTDRKEHSLMGGDGGLVAPPSPPLPTMTPTLHCGYWECRHTGSADMPVLGKQRGGSRDAYLCQSRNAKGFGGCPSARTVMVSPPIGGLLIPAAASLNSDLLSLILQQCAETRQPKASSLFSPLPFPSNSSLFCYLLTFLCTSFSGTFGLISTCPCSLLSLFLSLSVMSYFLMLSKSHGDELLSRYQNLRMEGRMCDVTLEADGKKFYAHRTLLACSSDYFWSLFQEHTLESRARTVSLAALSSAGLQQVLDFIYTSWISLSPYTLEDTLEAACYLQVRHAMRLCARYIMDSLSLDNCCFFANVAARYGLCEALAASNRFIVINMAKLLGASGGRVGLLELNLESFREVLGSEDMPGVKEVAVLHLALDWLACNPLPVLESNSLLSRVRFSLTPPRELSHLSALKPALRTPFIHSLVQKALHYHMQVPLQPLLQSIHTSLRTTSSKLLLVGGGPGADRPQPQIQTYDHHSKKLRPLSITMPKKLQHQGVCVVGNFLFVIGGEMVEMDEEIEKTAITTTSDRVWRYDPRFECWEEMEPLLQRRAQFSCCVVEGVIYSIGGRDQRGQPALSSVERYNMRAGCWRSGTHLPHAVYGQACATIGRGIYISGGIHGTQPESSKEVLFLNTLGPASWKRCAAMAIARFGHQMATIKERIYTFLGMYEPFCDIERYDPEQDQWTTLKPLLHDRFCYGLTVTTGGRVLLFGGRKWQDGQEVCTANVLEYDPEYDSWREACKLPAPLSGAQCVVMTIQEPTET